MNSSDLRFFDAILIKDNQRTSIFIGFSENQLKIKESDENSNIPSSFDYSALNIEVGGSGNSLIFFKQDDTVIYLRKNKDLTEILSHLNSPFLNPILSQQYAMKKKATLTYFGFFILLIITGFSFYKAKDPLVNYVADQIPYKYEKMIGDKVASLIISPTELITDSNLKAQLESLLLPLTRQLKPSIEKINVYVSKSNEINAYALPGGHIVFNAGLLKKAKRPEEILGVAAHELAHVSRRHGIKNVLQGAGLFLVIQTLFGDMTGIAALLADQGQFILLQKFSREFESEADHDGFGYLINAQIDPLGLRDFFKLLQNEHPEETELSKGLSYLSTHPQTAERIQTVENLFAELSSERRDQIKPSDFKLENLLESLSR